MHVHASAAMWPANWLVRPVFCSAWFDDEQAMNRTSSCQSTSPSIFRECSRRLIISTPAAVSGSLARQRADQE